jgi:hypothetical protein
MQTVSVSHKVARAMIEAFDDLCHRPDDVGTALSALSNALDNAMENDDPEDRAVIIEIAHKGER